MLTNPAYAASLTALAANGADAHHDRPDRAGHRRQDRAPRPRSTARAITPGKTTLADLAAYQAKKRDPVCTTYRALLGLRHGRRRLRAASPSRRRSASSRTSTSQLHKPTAIDLEGGKPTVLGVHLVTEAERLAYADRDKYVADTDFVPLPGGTWDTLLNKPYLQSRAGLINFTVSMGTAAAGNLGPVPLGIDTHGRARHQPVHDRRPRRQRAHRDDDGRVEHGLVPHDARLPAEQPAHRLLGRRRPTRTGAPIANRVAPGKRPRSSMAPTLVFRMAADGSKGDFFMATGSPGGGTIPQYVLKTLVGVLDWGLDAQQSSNLVDFGASNGPTTTIGGEHPNVNIANNGANDPLITGLRALGHTVSTGGAVERRQLDHAGAVERHAGAGRRHRSAARRRRARRHLRALDGGARFAEPRAALLRYPGRRRSFACVPQRLGTSRSAASVNLAQRLAREQTVAA